MKKNKIIQLVILALLVISISINGMFLANILKKEYDDGYREVYIIKLTNCDTSDYSSRHYNDPIYVKVEGDYVYVKFKPLYNKNYVEKQYNRLCIVYIDYI